VCNGVALSRQTEPPAVVLNEPSCYHFRVLDPRVSAIFSATMATATVITVERGCEVGARQFLRLILVYGMHSLTPDLVG
jgi:hypothetical protein